MHILYISEGWLMSTQIQIKHKAVDYKFMKELELLWFHPTSIILNDHSKILKIISINHFNWDNYNKSR